MTMQLAPPAPAVINRFWSKVTQLRSGCWLWTAGCGDDGYGKFMAGRQTWRAHRFAYFVTRGEPPEGHDLHHVCEQRTCVRPEHLIPVDRRTHCLLSPRNPTYRNALATHCTAGHEFNDANTYVHTGSNGRPARICRICNRRAVQQYKLRRKGTSP